MNWQVFILWLGYPMLGIGLLLAAGMASIEENPKAAYVCLAVAVVGLVLVAVGNAV